MTTAEAREVLIRYNAWRRYDGPLEQTPLQPGPKEIGEAIDVAIEVLPEEAEEASLDEAAVDHIRKVAAAAGHPEWGWTTQDIADAFIAGANYRRLKRLAEAAKSSSHLDAYIEGMRRSIEKQIGQLPPPPPGYYYTWELDTIRKEGQSFTAIARPILKQINPEHDEQLKAKH